MDKLTNITQHSQPTMSSREIATLCDKEHRNVCRDIENLNATYGQLGLPNFGETPYTHEPNLEYGKLSLPKVGETPYTHEPRLYYGF